MSAYAQNKHGFADWELLAELTAQEATREYWRRVGLAMKEDSFRSGALRSSLDLPD